MNVHYNKSNNIDPNYLSFNGTDWESYAGTFKDNEPDGLGTVSFGNQRKYIGFVQNH